MESEKSRNCKKTVHYPHYIKKYEKFIFILVMLLWRKKEDDEMKKWLISLVVVLIALFGVYEDPSVTIQNDEEEPGVMH